jgi:hypothetical protein
VSDPQERAAEDSAERVDKAAFINAEVSKRLHQNDEQPGVKPAKDARTEYVAPRVSPKRKADDAP